MTFERILEELAAPMKDFIGKTDENGVEITLEYIYPKKCQLIKYWTEKGYQPKSVKVH